VPNPASAETRVALITGAASPIGIGASTGKRLLRDGWSVWLVDANERVEETARQLAQDLALPDGRVAGSMCDVTQEAQVERAVADLLSRFGRLDLAVANAGIAGQEIDLIDQTPDAFDHIVAVNLRGVYLTCRATGRVMRAARSGSIVTISSIFGQEPFAKAAAYSATKAGVVALTQSLARELGPFGVRVNSIAPGYIRTDMLNGSQQGRAERADLTFEEESQRVDAMVPLRRHGTGDDVAAAIAFLASDEASYVTGHTLGVTGGIVMR
jgi:NAD(P)-dependent dehydrogenase (short-subunit alcohol dehydrogenase family)